MRDFAIPEMACPACDARLDRAAALNHGHAPKPGDFTVCIGCGAILRFGVEGLVAVAPDSLQELDAQQRRDVLRASSLIRSWRSAS